MLEEQNISIKLTANIWNVVLSALAKRPYEESQPIIDEIKRQGQEQLNPNLEATVTASE
jgi:hypothetical protein